MEGEQQQPKITTVEKVKDPKRVEQGKRLAAISREAKARKAAERAKVEECVEKANVFYTVLGTLGAAGLGYFVYNNFFSMKKEEEKEPPQKQQVRAVEGQQQQQKQQQPEKKKFRVLIEIK